MHKTPITLVREFHEAFDLPIADRPAFPDDECRNLRLNLLGEEYDELRLAEDADDLVEVADAIGDMIYILAGTALAYGINLDAVFAEIHRSNMSKMDASGLVLRRLDGKVLKPKSFSPPDLASVLFPHPTWSAGSLGLCGPS